MVLCAPVGMWTPSRPDRARVHIGDAVLVLEVAATPEQIDRGLSRRGALGAGMLFAFETSEPRVFAMRDCDVALDLVYVDDSGVVTDVFAMEPETPRGADEARDDADGDARYEARLKGYVSSVPTRYAIELCGGTAATAGFRVGERVVIERAGRASQAEQVARR